LVVVIVEMAGCFIAQPTFRRNHPSAVSVDADRLKVHVSTLSRTFHPRDWEHPANLAMCADYIATQFTNAGAVVESQEFKVQGNRYRNVIGRFGVGKASKVVVGAHYDTCGDTPGADDNASGIAALIELAYLAGADVPQRELELVAYVLEEPPFFRTSHMGSAIHAESIAREKSNIIGVIVLESVGCFNDEKGSQSYPSLMLRAFYPSRGDFIAVAGRWDQGDWIKAVKVGMLGSTDLPVYSIRAPSALPGIDFSDHINYWPYGINAAMVTDTAFYRNKAYHESEDTADRLDYDRMSMVVVAVFEALRK
jgi:Zn-dependent M28 family amino/carboxypeptidase